MSAMLAKLSHLAGGALLAALGSTALAQQPSTSSTSGVPTSAAATAAVDVNSAIGGRVIACPKGLRISPEAVCLFANATVESLKPRVKAKLGNRVIEDWKTRTGSQNASLLFRTGNDITYVLLAQTQNSVLAVIDAPAAGGAQAQGAASTAPGATSGVAYAAAKDLAGLVSVQAADTVGTFTRLGQSVVVTANNRSARFGTGALTLAGTPYSAGGQLYVPVTLLRNLNCVVGEPQGGKVNVTCGAKSASVNVTMR